MVGGGVNTAHLVTWEDSLIEDIENVHPSFKKQQVDVIILNTILQISSMILLFMFITLDSILVSGKGN